MRRFALTDERWAVPLQRPRTGRPAEDHRRILNGMLWVLRTGAPWADLLARYGPAGTVSSRFYRWRQAGVFAQRACARRYHRALAPRQADE